MSENRGGGFFDSHCRVGFSGTVDLMALFSIRTHSRWRPSPSWIISNGHISAMAHDLLI